MRATTVMTLTANLPATIHLRIRDLFYDDAEPTIINEVEFSTLRINTWSKVYYYNNQ